MSKNSSSLKKMSKLFRLLRDLIHLLPQKEHQLIFSKHISFLEELIGNLMKEIDRKRNSLEEFQEYHRTVLASVTDMIFILDDQQNIAYTNPAVFNNLGFLGPEILGKSIDDLLLEKKISQIIREEIYYGPEEQVLVSKKGEKIPCLVVANAIFLKNRPYGHVCIVQNIQEKKREEDLLNQVTFFLR